MQQSKSENPVAKAYTVSPSKSISSALVSDLQKSGYIRKNFDDLNLNKCIGRLVYGTEIMRVDKKRTDKPKRALFYILETDLTKLKWISLKTGKTKHILDLTTVSNVSELPFYLSKAIKKYDPSQVLSVQYSHGKELVLIFEDSVKKREWWCGLQYFIEEIHKFGSDATALPTMKEIAHHFFMSADLDGTKTLDKKEVKKLLNKLQIYVKKSEIKLLFEKYDANKNDKIEITEFENFMTELFRKEELVPIFQKYASAYVANDCENPTMSLNDLMKFFEEQQHQPITLETARKIHPSFKDVSMMKPCISFDFFGTIIFSLMNTIFNPERSYIYQDMTRPLTDYYINSSHNTYLMSNQLTGESSILAYINALNKGCRCVELDIWTGPNSTPIIYHGHTMTTKILFEDVIKVIHEHAFANSQYPLILSFENHCDLKTQEKMVEILKNEIGDLIYPVPDNFEDFKFYPSPEELMGKIIIKGTSMLKRGNEQQPQQELDNGIEEDSDTDEKSLIPEKSVVNEKSLETFGNMSELLETSEKPSAMARYATPIKKVPNSGRARRPLNENVLHSSDSEGEGDGSGRSKSSVGKQRINTAISSIRTPSQKVHGLQVNTFEIRKNSSQPIQKDLSAPLPSKMKIDIQQASGSIGDDIVAFKSAEGTPKPTTDTKDVKDIIGSKKFLELDDIIVSHTHLNGNNNIKESKTAYVIPNRDLESPTKIVPLSEDLAKKEEKNAKAAQTKNAIKATKRDSEFASNSQLDVDLNDLCKSIPMLGGKKESQFAGRNNDPSSRKGTYKASDHATKHDHHKKAQTVKVLPELGAMYAMIGRHMHFDDKRTVWEISSLNESKIAKLFKTQYKKIIDFHKSFLSRIYPLGSRIDSSNYEPTIGWATGSQIVALNFQKSDEPMLLNYAKFLANGGIKSGYILKPEYMRHESLTNKELVQYPDFKKPLKKLTVKVISGQQIRPDNFVINQVVDPFIEVKIKGLEIDEHNNGVFRTHTNKDNGFHPTWSTEEDKVKQKFEFLIHAPDFCTLVFTAYHGEVLKKDKMGWYAIEFNNIQQGYRVVPLLNNLFQPIKNSYVFCKISITDI